MASNVSNQFANRAQQTRNVGAGAAEAAIVIAAGLSELYGKKDKEE
jgi:hypothetical protein